MRSARIAVALLPAAVACGPRGPADTVLLGGRVFTMAAGQPWAEAVAVRGDRIAYVGTREGAQSLIGERTIEIDLAGGLMLPGFIDGHVHPLSEYGLQLEGRRTRAAIFDAIAAYALAHPAEAWVEGYGWDLSVFDESGPRREWLDSLIPDRPALIWGGDGHSVWSNTRALEAAGITRETPDPEGGRIERAADGAPSGTLREAAATLIERMVPPWSPAKRLAALENTLARMRAFGITGFLDASVDDEAMLEAYREAARSGLLTAHASLSLAIPRESGDADVDSLVTSFQLLRETVAHEDLSVSTAKIFVDGVIEAGTAAMLEPYAGTAGDRGELLREPATLKALTRALHEAGFQLHYHAIGDRAIRVVLDAIESGTGAASANPSGGGPGRPLIAHAQLVDPADVSRFANLGAIPVFSALWAYEDSYIRDLTVPRLGAERSRWIYPMRTLSDAGAVLAFGSDWPVTTMNPLQAIEVAVTRIDPGTPGDSGTAFLPDERLDLAAALEAYTLGSARATLRDHETGSIETGKRADLVALSDDLFAIPAWRIGDARVVLTMYGGRIVHLDSARLLRQ
ncbi:MAG: amidohydrolase [Gemmatimonadetes bacterium]|nr:amidohydrolase [Gemmatimonadota bacterium]